MASAVTGHLLGVAFLPESSLMVCHAFRLEWIDSTTAVHLDLRVSSSFCSNVVAVASISSLELTCWCWRSRQLHSSSQPGM